MNNFPISQFFYLGLFVVFFLPLQALRARRWALAAIPVGLLGIAAGLLWMRFDHVDLNSLYKVVLMIGLVLTGAAIAMSGAARAVALALAATDRKKRWRLTAAVTAACVVVFILGSTYWISVLH